MSFNISAAAYDDDFWKGFSNKYKTKLLEAGWIGPLQAEGIEEAVNHDAFESVLFEAVRRDAKEVAFAESDSQIPGGADFASIKKLFGCYFVIGSSVDEGPFKSRSKAQDVAGLSG
jgi:hypothetical protein